MYTFIVNPNSRSGLGKTVWDKVQTVLEERGITYKVFFTKHQRHATNIARELTSDGNEHTLIILGGDGTINEVINGICELQKVTIGYIPTGSGNDFARSFRLPTEPIDALDNILKAEHIQKMDVGELSYKNIKRRFAVSSGIGFDASICHEVVVSHWKSILNRLKLGKLSVCLLANISKLKMLFLLPTALFGKHIYFKGVHTYDCKSISIRFEKALPLHTDGEPCFLQKEIFLRCLPKQVNIITANKHL